MKGKDKDIKSFNIRLTREMWMFLKKEAANRETSMTNLIQMSVDKFKNRCEKKELTDSGASV